MRKKRVKRKDLPPPCPECRSYDGAWRMDAFSGAMERCGCPRGQILKHGLRNEPRGPKARRDGKQAATGE